MSRKCSWLPQKSLSLQNLKWSECSRQLEKLHFYGFSNLIFTALRRGEKRERERETRLRRNLADNG